MSFRTSESAQWSEPQDSGAAGVIRSGVVVLSGVDYAIDTNPGATRVGYIVLSGVDYAIDTAASSGRRVRVRSSPQDILTY